MTKEKTIEDVISDWCDMISNDIAERRFYDKSEVAAYAKVKLHTAIHECLTIQTSDLEKKRNDFVIQYNTPDIPQYRKIKMAAELAELNFKIKERNKIVGMERYLKEYFSLKTYVRNNYGKDVLNDFFYKVENHIDF